MGAKNYSKVGAALDTSSTMDAGPEPAKTKSRRGLYVGLAVGAVALLLIILAAASCSGGGDDATTATPQRAIGSAHGPMSITAGIPVGFTHDKAGAATAAVTFVNAVSEANLGRISGAELKTQRVGTNASEMLLKVMSDVSDRREVTDNVASSAPAATTVTSYTNEKAVVSIWAVTVSQTKLNDEGKTGVMALWSTTTVTLAWSGEDWLAVDWEYANGPDPKDATFPTAGSPLAQKMQAGYYSFYVD